MSKQYKFTSPAALETAREEMQERIRTTILAWPYGNEDTRFYLFLRPSGFVIVEQKAWEQDMKQTKKNKILQNYEMAGMINYAEVEDF